MKLTHNNTKTKALETLLLNEPELGAGMVGVFDLPAGHTCPGAKDCLSKASKNEDGTWSLTDYGTFRCYAASAEVMYPSVRRLRWKNFNDAINSRDLTCDLSTMVEYSPYKYIRLHSSGDFFNMKYMDAWLEVADKFPNRVFYGYTKVPWILDEAFLPSNFRFNLSLGGKYDELFLKQDRIPVTGVAIDPTLNYPHPLIFGAQTEVAVIKRQSFYIPIHGTQPAGSREGEAVSFWRKAQKEV